LKNQIRKLQISMTIEEPDKKASNFNDD